MDDVEPPAAATPPQLALLRVASVVMLAVGDSGITSVDVVGGALR